MYTERNTDEFNLQRVCILFEKCLEENLDLKFYIDGFLELNKLFSKLGGLFKFIVHDVNEKTQILLQHLNSSTKINYINVETMLNHEMLNNLLADPDKQSESHLVNGSRTLLRLHRALLFIMKFTEGIIKSDDAVQMAPIARNAYDNTIACYHPWLIKKAVHLALYTLPNRNRLVAELSGTQICTEEANLIMDKTLKVYQTIYDGVQKLYSKKNLLDLP